MNHKIREYQGLTFDDVLLEPALQRGRAGRCRRHAPSSRGGSASISPCSARPWTPSPRATWPSPWPRRGGSASSTRICPIERQAEEVEKVKRSANGIIRQSGHPPARCHAGPRPRDHGPVQRLRAADHPGRRPAGRHPHPPRPALPGELGHPHLGGDDPGKPGHGHGDCNA